MRFFLFIFPFCFLRLFTGCQSEEVKLNSIGKESEILVVCNDSLYDTEAVKSVLSVLISDYPALPQQEPLFDVTRINESGFTEIFKRHKAVLRIELSEDKTRITVKRNEYAHQQAVLQLRINRQDIHDSLAGSRLGSVAADFFTKEDRKNRIEKLNKAHSKKISETVFKNFGFRMAVPEDFYIATEANHFMWLRRETSNTSSAILIYSVPFSTAFNPVMLRDSLTREYIPGPSEGSYMAVNKEFEPVIYRDSLFNHPAIVTRGIWKVENDFMGGPFVNICIPDSSQNRILCLDGFVYAPKFDKREYINRLLAILYSAKSVR